MTANDRVDLDREERLILSLLFQASRGTTEKENIGDDRLPPLDYDKVLRLASVNGVSSFVYSNLKGRRDIPADVIERLHAAYLKTFSINIRKAGETIRILGLLKERGIEAIPLKGSLASDIIFHDMGLYPSSDIDILVSPSDLEKTGTILVNEGYSGSGDTEEEALIGTDYHLIFHNDAYVVEVHWNLVKRYFAVPPGFWWENRVKTSYEGSEITLLSVERYLLYSIFRLFFHAFRPLKFLVFVAALLNEYLGRIDWQEFFSSAKDCGMERLTLFTLRLLHDISGAEIPSPALNRKLSAYAFLKRVVISGFFTVRTRIHLRMFLYTFLLDSPLDTVKVVLRRIFPDPAEIRLRYGLHGKPKKVFLYYLLNPLFLLLKRR